MFVEDDASQDVMPANQHTNKRARNKLKTGRRNPKVIARNSVETLARMGFDPIVELVKLYNTITNELMSLRFNPDGTMKVRYSMVAYTNLLATQQKLLNDLTRYGYARVSETTISETKETGGLVINLTSEGDVIDVISDTAIEDFEDNEDEDLNEDSDDVIDQAISAIGRMRLNNVQTGN